MFGDGRITFKAKLKDYKVIRDFSVENENLRSEFENIKPWFVKRIGKFFIVTINLKLVNGQIDDASAFSEDISTINNEMIESIKTQRVLMLVKTARIKDDKKAVFDNDEVFGVLDEGQGTNVFESSADNIIEILIKNGLAKNIRQLEFLSKDKHSLNEKLRFTLKPLFGFLFKVETPTKQFFIWELLNSHATYIWEKEINDADFYQFVEHEISYIKENGRDEYRRYYKNLQSKNLLISTAKKYNIENHIIFTGNVSNDDILSSLYYLADIHVFPVKHIPDDPEGFGMVAIEAAAHGIPTVAFSTGGIVDAIENESTGYLIENQDYQEMTNAISRILKNKTIISEQACIQYAEQFAWYNLRNKFERILVNL
ncbi:MAG: glycosyltransferase, partial [Flavobacterium sp.]